MRYSILPNAALLCPARRSVAALVLTIALCFDSTLIAQTPPPPQQPRGANVNTSWWPFATRVKGDGPIRDGVRDVRGFDGLLVKGMMNVYISQGEQPSVRVVTHENFTEQVKAEVTGDGVLELSIAASHYQYDSLAVYVTVPHLRLLQLDECCTSIQFITPLVGSHLTTNVNGTACTLTFAGGTLGRHNITIQGSGSNVDAKSVRTAAAKLMMTGINPVCSINADEIDLDAPGIGSRINYTSGNRIIKSSVGFSRTIMPLDSAGKPLRH
jgi:hypothetical protein